MRCVLSVCAAPRNIQGSPFQFKMIAKLFCFSCFWFVRCHKVKSAV
jgi:hypothetical protein